MYEDNKDVQKAWQLLHKELVKIKYVYNFSWFGLPILQVPQDLQAKQEIIWKVKPDIIIETGVAAGGSLMFSATMLMALEGCGLINDGKVIGIEINLYPQNLNAIINHPLSKKIILVQASSVDKGTIASVYELVKGKKVMVFLDSNHTHNHVLKELRAYAHMVSVGGYIVVEDTGIEDLPKGTTSDRPWGKGNNPKTAVWEFLKENDNFEIDDIYKKLIMTGNPSGYLKRIR